MKFRRHSLPRVTPDGSVMYAKQGRQTKQAFGQGGNRMKKRMVVALRGGVLRDRDLNQIHNLPVGNLAFAGADPAFL